MGVIYVGALSGQVSSLATNANAGDTLAIKFTGTGGSITGFAGNDGSGNPLVAGDKLHILNVGDFDFKLINENVAQEPTAYKRLATPGTSLTVRARGGVELIRCAKSSGGSLRWHAETP